MPLHSLAIDKRHERESDRARVGEGAGRFPFLCVPEEDLLVETSRGQHDRARHDAGRDAEARDSGGMMLVIGVGWMMNVKMDHIKFTHYTTKDRVLRKGCTLEAFSYVLPTKRSFFSSSSITLSNQDFRFDGIAAME